MYNESFQTSAQAQAVVNQTHCAEEMERGEELVGLSVMHKSKSS